MSVWAELTGQKQAIEVLRAAAAVDPGRAAPAAAADTSGPAPAPASVAPGGSPMTHAWLLTGPPGSGRSNLAFAFASALLSHAGADGDELTERQVQARTHPDLSVLSTEKVIITIDEVRELVRSAQYSPSVGRYRVLVIEDADRMTERTSNLLLKSLEEPPERTVWVLCAPSDADLLPTIRSRVRTVRLTVPTIDDVAALLVQRDGIAPELAEQAARHAQSHIGMARRLATNAEARVRRDETLDLVLGVRSISAAVTGAARLVQIATEDGKAITEERDAQERADALRSLGVEPGGTIPPALRSQLRALEEDQKRRATRSLRDGLDRILVDLLSLYRDVLMLQLGSEAPLVTREREVALAAIAGGTSPAQTLTMMDAIAEARTRIDANVNPTLALEAMLATAVAAVAA
jgi:DNA polymerase-3 subunit delta'